MAELEGQMSFFPELTETKKPEFKSKPGDIIILDSDTKDDLKRKIVLKQLELNQVEKEEYGWHHLRNEKKSGLIDIIHRFNAYGEVDYYGDKYRETILAVQEAIKEFHEKESKIDLEKLHTRMDLVEKYEAKYKEWRMQVFPGGYYQIKDIPKILKKIKALSEETKAELQNLKAA